MPNPYEIKRKNSSSVTIQNGKSQLIRDASQVKLVPSSIKKSVNKLESEDEHDLDIISNRNN